MSQRRPLFKVAAMLFVGYIGWFLLDVRSGDGDGPIKRRDVSSSGQASAADAKSNVGELQELRELLKQLQEDHKKNRDDILWQATTNPPVGAILTYAGEWPPKTAAGEEQTEEQTAESLGWMRCAGGRLPKDKFPELYAVLKETQFLKETETHFHLPDLCGYFLRGIDTSGTGDTASRDPEGRRLVGHVQSHAFASHQHHVKLEGGKHSHNIKFVAAVEGPAGDADGDTDPHGAHKAPFNFDVGEGAHRHEGDTDATGGMETRPMNIAVHFIIKVKSN